MRRGRRGAHGGGTGRALTGLAVVALPALGAVAARLVSARRVARRPGTAPPGPATPDPDDARRSQFRDRLGAAVDLVNGSDDVADVFRRAVVTAVPQAAVELLLVDTDDELRREAWAAPAGGPPACGVPGPDACPAMRRGSLQRFDDSDAFDACPRLRGRATPRLSAVCVPVPGPGRPAGVLHATAAQPFSAPAAADLAGVADFAGRALRAVGAGGPSAPAAAAVHPAGLLDRRGFADGFARARTEVPRVAVAVAELDGLGVLDGTLGPDMVERCLRLLADVLRSSLRDRDLVGRLDGDGIVMAFPGCRLDDARRALDAVRGRLDAAVTVAGVAPFTASFGVVETGEREDPTTVVGRATAALVEARRAGGDRVVVHDAAGRVKEAPQDGWGPNHDVLTRQRRDFTPGTAIRPADDALPQILPDPPADGPHPTDPDGGPGER